MIKIYPASDAPRQVRKYAFVGEDVFVTARDFYHQAKDIRHHKVVVYDADGSVAYCLGFEQNRPENLEDPNSPRVQMYLPRYWDYAEGDEDLDWSYVDRFQLIVYSEIEEYSHHTAQLILRHNPSAVVAFTDPRASLFFEASERLFIADSAEALFDLHPELKDLRTLNVHPDIKWDVSGVFRNDVSSIVVMESLYWVRREVSYGPLNPDKTFYLIKQPVKENGLTALLANIVGTKQMIRAIKPDFIPIVDLGIDNDPNQFAGTSGEDVWSIPIGSVNSFKYSGLKPV